MNRTPNPVVQFVHSICILLQVLSLPSNFTYNPPGAKITLEQHPRQQARRQTLHSHQPIMLSNLDDIKNIDESVSDIYSIQECSPITSDKGMRQSNFDEIVTISSSRESIYPKFEELVVKRTNETNEQSINILLVPQDTKPFHKLYGSTKHLFTKQLSMDISEETPFLLTVPGSHQKGEQQKTPLPKHDSQESVQRIITERRKLDENLKEINQYDIFDVTRNDSEEKLVEQRGGGNNESDSQC